MRDTTDDAIAVRTRVYRAMTGAQRCDLAEEMSIAARELALAGIRTRHPDYDADQARSALLRMILGDHLFRRVWPNAPLLSP
jgi:hypothetical protein